MSWGTGMDISEKVDWLKIDLNQKIDGLYRDIDTTAKENKKLYMSQRVLPRIEKALELQDENLKNVRNWIKNKFPNDINTIEYKTLAEYNQEQGMVANTSNAVPVRDAQVRAPVANVVDENTAGAATAEAAKNAETPPATQASPGFFGWFKSTPTGGRSGYKKQKTSSKRITSKRITRKRKR
jgi:hypothetical protein